MSGWLLLFASKMTRLLLLLGMCIALLVRADVDTEATSAKDMKGAHELASDILDSIGGVDTVHISSRSVDDDLFQFVDVLEREYELQNLRKTIESSIQSTMQSSIQSSIHRSASDIFLTHMESSIERDSHKFEKGYQCAFSGRVGDCLCDHSTVDELNNEILYPLLAELANRRAFRFFKVRLRCSCPFWNDTQSCSSRYCSVCECDNEDVPRLPWTMTMRQQKRIGNSFAPKSKSMGDVGKDSGPEGKDTRTDAKSDDFAADKSKRKTATYGKKTETCFDYKNEAFDYNGSEKKDVQHQSSERSNGNDKRDGGQEQRGGHSPFSYDNSPFEIINGINLNSEIERTATTEEMIKVLSWTEEDNPWTHEDESLDDNALYVDLLVNPERYTGYEGEKAHRIWNAIYDQNCFHGLDAVDSDSCKERRVMYRLISGMHTSITAHLASHYPQNSNEYSYDGTNIDDEHGIVWGPNLDVFEQRLAHHPSRIENLYFTFLFVLRAVMKAKDQFLTTAFETGETEDDYKTNEIIREMVTNEKLYEACPLPFDEGRLWSGEGGHQLRNQLMVHFRNICEWPKPF